MNGTTQKSYLIRLGLHVYLQASKYGRNVIREITEGKKKYETHEERKVQKDMQIYDTSWNLNLAIITKQSYHFMQINIIWFSPN